MTIKNSKRHCRGSKSKAKKEWEKRERASRPRPRHEPITKKKKKEPSYEYDECVVCYDSVPVISNNIQRCGKAKHILCAHCKLILLNDQKSCPICRKEHIRRPAVRWQIDYQPSYINIYKHAR
tara:strand:- start:126 stop:494 length:369 start_codon:yes stop_codon:yes gene_type:complete